MPDQTKTTSPEDLVRAKFRSARIEKKGLSHFAVRAVERDPVTMLLIRDHFLGWGKSEAVAWKSAAASIAGDTDNE